MANRGSARWAYSMRVKNKNNKFSRVPIPSMSRQNSWDRGSLPCQRSDQKPGGLGCSFTAKHRSSKDRFGRVWGAEGSKYS